MEDQNKGPQPVTIPADRTGEFLKWLHELTTLGYEKEPQLTVETAHSDVINYYFLMGYPPAQALPQYVAFRRRMKALQESGQFPPDKPNPGAWTLNTLKKGKWNYTEDILYKVVVVRLLPVADPVLAWQNAFAGQERQAVWVMDATNYTFLIDNQDGSGLRKIARNGGPDSYSAHIMAHELIRDLPESEWQYWDPAKYQASQEAVATWQKENHPEEYEKLQRLIAAAPKFTR